jgi:hypothetical protein
MARQTKAQKIAKLVDSIAVAYKIYRDHLDIWAKDQDNQDKTDRMNGWFKEVERDQEKLRELGIPLNLV